jgi:hypothetical protein
LSAALVAERGWWLVRDDRNSAARRFGEAAALMRNEADPEALGLAARYRANQWLYAQENRNVLMDSARTELDAWLHANPASAALWFELATLEFALGEFQNAHSAAEKSRFLDATKADDPGMSLLVFLSAFNARMDREALNECDRMRHAMAGSWPATACTALAVAWAGASYDLRGLLANGLARDPARVRAELQPRVAALLAAAHARRGERDLAEKALAQSGDGDSLDLQACRALATGALGDVPRALALRNAIAARPNGVKVLQMYERAFDDMGDEQRR